MSKADELIYELLCEIENDTDNKITIDYIYEKLSKYAMQDINKIGSKEE